MALRAVSRFEEPTRRYSSEELATPPQPQRTLTVHVDCNHPHRPRVDWIAVIVIAVLLEALMRAVLSVVQR